MRRVLGALLASGMLLIAGVAEARIVSCPARLQGKAFHAVTVYDGPVEEMASLMPDEDANGRSYWDLGYVYDHGRTAYIECEYAGGVRKVITLQEPVERCALLSLSRVDCQ